MFNRIFLITITSFGTLLSSISAQAITLEAATYQAIENSPTVRQSIAKYQETLENKKILERSGYYPSVDLAAGIGHETTYDYGNSSDDVSLARRELTLSLNQPIFNGFSTKYDIQRLHAEAEADRWEALIAVENAALEVAQAFANVLRYRELAALADMNLKSHQRIYEQIKLKSDTGIGRKSDLSQITARLAKAYANNLAAINNLRDAESSYKNVVGELPPEELIYPVPDRDLLPTSLEEAINQALTKNPAIEGAKWDVSATDSYKLVTEAEKYPSINFVLERTWNNNLDGDEGASEDLLAMIRLNYNLYSGGTYKRKKGIAEQQNIQASEIRNKTIRDTELTVRLAWAAYEATTGQKEHIQQYVIATKESQIAYDKQFRLGRRTLLDVLDSENELFQARQDYVNADYDELFSEFRLFNAKGELMRAFRIYRPSLLGFNDEFEKDQKISVEKDQKISVEKEKNTLKEPPAIKADEATQESSSINGEIIPTEIIEASDSSGAKKSLEDELFIDSEEGAAGWQ